MKRIFSFLSILAAIVIVPALYGCSDNDVVDEVPPTIYRFIQEYYPSSTVESYLSTDNMYRVVIKDGPGITFNKNFDWLSMNGYGSTLPQVFLFNEFPPELYSYLQETENLDNVFAVERNAKYYTVTLLDYTILYDVSTGAITGQDSHRLHA